MTNRELLKEINRDNKSISRGVQHLANMGLLAMLGKIAEDAKAKDDEVGKKIAIIGVVLVVISEILLLAGNIIDYKKMREE